MRARLTLALTFALALGAPASAAPRDEALRVAPTDFALVVVVQNLRDHGTAVSESPFASWFPTSALGKQFLASAAFKKITDASTPIFATLGITPTELLQDIVGDTLVFAYTPAPPGDAKAERSVILVRPRKVELLVTVMDRLNDAQTKSKELKALIPHKHAGETYFERQKPQGPSDFYCFRDGVFAFSSSEAEIKAVIDRDKSLPKDKTPVLVARMTKLGVTDAAAVLLVNPRSLDTEVAAKVKNAKPDERAFQTKFAEVWAATDSVAIYFTLDTGVELGVSVQFNTEKLPAHLKTWLAGERTPSALWSVIPDDAMLAVAGRVKLNDLIDLLGLLPNAEGKPGVRETIEQALGPIIGRDKLPLVLGAIGPDFGMWIMPPAPGTKNTVPVLVGGVKIEANGPKGAEVSKALLQSLEYGFQVGRVAYNVKHKDQIELREEKDGDVIIKSLSCEAFPAGFRPCFALKGGYLLVSTSPDAIKSFRAPTGEPKPGGDVPLARFNATAARGYLASHSSALAKWLASAGAGDAQTLAEQLGGLGDVLEQFDKVELLSRGDATGAKLMLRIKTAKPLKK